MVRRRIPHPNVPTEVRQAFQRATEDTSILTDGAAGEVLVGVGVGSTPAWGTSLTALTLLTCDNITINGAAITSDTGAISFGNENLSTTGTIGGVNVTSGADPGHTHTGASLSGIDISADTNLAVTAPIVLTDDTLSLNQAGIDHGSLGGLMDDDHTQYLLADGSRDLTGDLSVDAGITIDGRDISADGALLDEAYGWGDHGSEPYLWSSDTGTAWTDLGTMFSQTKIWCLEYVGSGVALAGTYNGGKVLRSTDYGANWSDLGQQASEQSIRSLCNLGSGIVIGGTGANGKIIRSTDYGATWSDLGQQHSCAWIYCLADCGSGIVIAGTSASGKILRSTDSGATWSDLGSPDGGTSTQVYSIIYLGSGIALAGTTGTGKVFRSTDYGATWSDLGQQHSVDGVRCFVHLGSGTVLAGTGNGGKLLKSTDWGANWTDEGQVGAETKFGYFAYTGTVLIAGFNDSGRVYVSTDDGDTWTNLGVQGSAAGILSAAYLENDISVIGTRDNGKILRSTGYSTTSVTPANWDAAYDAIGKAAVDSSATADYLGAASNDGVLRTGSGLSYYDGGDYVTLALDINGLAAVSPVVAADAIPVYDETAGASRKVTFANLESSLSHDSLGGFVAAEHVSLPNTIANVLTDHTLAAHTALGLQEVVTDDTTYYISTTGNDSTGDGSSGSPWATLDKALTTIESKLIAGDSTVTIIFKDGTYTIGSADTLNHVNGDQIEIEGENSYDITLSSIQSSGGAAGAWSIVLNVSDVSNCAVNDYVLIPYSAAGGTRPETLCGCHKITNVDVPNTRITVTSKSLHTAAPSGAVAGTITVIKTMLSYSAAGCDGIIIDYGKSLGNLDKLVLVGGAANNGITVRARAFFQGGTQLGIDGFSYGLEALNSTIVQAGYLIVSGAASRGVNAYWTDTTYLSYGVFSGCGAYGVVVESCRALLYAAVASGNVNGVYGQISATISMRTPAKITYNTTTGLKAWLNSIVDAATATCANNGTDFSPAANTLGSVESYIRN